MSAVPLQVQAPARERIRFENVSVEFPTAQGPMRSSGSPCRCSRSSARLRGPPRAKRSSPGQPEPQRLNAVSW